MVAGLVLTCLGGPAEQLSYQLSRRGDSPLDLTVQDIVHEGRMAIEIRPFDPTDGSDERQYCSPGFNLPMGQMARTVYGRYPEYHNSLDTKSFMNVETVWQSAAQIEAILKRAEISGTYRNLKPFGEPQLGKRNLFPTLNGPSTRHHSNDALPDQRKFLKQIMMVLSYSDGQHRLADIASQCGCSVTDLEPVVEVLERENLLAIYPRVDNPKCMC